MKIKVSESELLNYEKELYGQGITLIGGVDEAGRGPLVGPVVAACVILPVNYELEGLNDSKQLSEKKRDLLFDIIMKDAISVGVGIVEADMIDKINILEASRLAMKLAIDNMDVKPEFVLSDAMKLTNIDIPYKDIVHGDALSLSIAAGSVIAKVTRDRMMYDLDKEYPEYEFAKHKGYPTKAHLEKIKEFGVLKNYRFTYKPVSDLIKDAKVVIR
jgi:ribonuclease HII